VVTYNWGAIESVAVSIVRHCPIIHTEDGFGPDEAVKLHSRRVWVRRLLLPRVHCTVVPSRTLLKIASDKYRLSAGKVRLIVNGVDPIRFQPARDPELREQLGCGEDTVVFGYVGYLRPEKNLLLLLEAFARAGIDNSRLILIGDGDQRGALEQKARELGISDSVVFAGHVSQPDRYFAVLDVFTMSSITEQMPISLLEAMACGLPVICTDVGDSGELAGGVPPAVVPSRDLDAYTHSICLLAGDSTLRKKLGDANRQRCLRDFTLDRMIHQYEEVYFAAAGRSLSEFA
jgi:glycosyltransferase involved in cell wall biosynthesis